MYIGNFDDFVLTSLSLQGNNALFIDKSQTERKEILSQFIGVDVFDKLYQIAYEDNKENATLIKKFKRDDFTTKLAEIDDQLNKKLNDYKLVQNDLQELTDKEDELNDLLLHLNSQIVSVRGDDVELDTLQDNLKDSELKLKNISERYSNLQKKINDKEERQIDLEEKIDLLDEDGIESGIEEYNKIDSELYKLENTIDKKEIKKDSLTERKEHLDSHKYNENCEICMDNSKTILEQKEKVTKDLLEITNELNDLKKLESKLLDNKKTLSKFESEWQKLKNLKDEEHKIGLELNNLLYQFRNLESDESDIKDVIQKTKTLIKEWHENEVQINKNNKIREEIKSTNLELKKVKTEKNTTNSKLLKLNGEVSSFRSNKNQIEERIQEVKELEEQSKLYDFYLNALGKDGIPYELIEKALPMIEGEVNNILGQIVEFGMQLEMDGKNINAHLVYGSQKWSLEMCSGMERFISGLAIRVALINVCNLPRPNFLVIDEGFGTLDSENLQSLFMLFSYLKTQFDFVMIISHIDSMRDVVDDIIEIKKQKGRSFVKY